ncbi:MAG: HlyC/CorC family transporter [Oscillospiraceae bacterium]|nr:HlyC/CorC family transporter [Oscillospiraceae bacterium]
MESDNTISLIIIIFCVVMSAYFSATETAFSSINRIRVKNMADKGNKKAALVLKMSDNYDSMLSTILIGNNIVNILGASLATVLFVKLLGDESGPTVSTAVTTVIVLIFGEISPKSIAKESPESFAMFSAPLLNILMYILTPFNFLFRQWKKLLSLIFKGSADNGITEEELLSIVEEAEQDGGINEQEGMLIRSAMEFTEIEASEILTPRIDITAVPADADKEEIARIFAETAYSRLPVYENSIDHITGIIYHKDFHNMVYHTDKDISNIIKPALFVPENKKIGILLKELQAKKSHIAVIVDEYGGTIGIVTLEDILEELVGEIWDEHDEITKDIEKASDRLYIVSGSANAEKVLSALEIDDDDTEASTMSGWIMTKLGRIPEKNDSLEYKGFTVTVTETDGKRADKLRFCRIAETVQNMAE